MNLADPFNRIPSRASRDEEAERAHRVRLAMEVRDALLEGRMPAEEARLFFGGALSAWLERGGPWGCLEAIYLRTNPPRGSRRTAQVVARGLQSKRRTDI